jgi:type II protein arginine methyltransferase
MPTKSPDMISWFPIYFPLKTPLYVPDGGELGVSMWRRSDERKVWYEWKVEAYAFLHSRGRGRGAKVRIGGTELHSSEKEACMM